MSNAEKESLSFLLNPQGGRPNAARAKEATKHHILLTGNAKQKFWR